MKKIFLGIFIFLCFVPLFSKIDNYEDFLFNNYYSSEGIYNYSNATVTGEYAHFKSNNNKQCLSENDGSSINAEFIPFGTLVTACSDDYYIHILTSSIKFHLTKSEN